MLSKVAEKIALIQFNDFLTKQDKLTEHQSGNRKNHSTETLSILVTDHIFRAIDQQQSTAMVLAQEKITDSHFGYFRIFKEYPQKSQTLNYPKMGILYFFLCYRPQ